jgi:sulfur-carrier protein
MHTAKPDLYMRGCFVYKTGMTDMTDSEQLVCVTFAASLQRHIPCALQQVAPASLRDVLHAALQAAPDLKHYVFDDQGNIRKHVAVFINKNLLANRNDLTQNLAAGDHVLVVQALTGG